MPRGHWARPRVRLSWLSVTRPPTFSMTCRRTALNAGPEIILRTGFVTSSITVCGSARGSISCEGCSVKPTMGICSASDKIIATWMRVKPNTMNFGRLLGPRSRPSVSCVAQWYMQPSLGKNSTSDRDNINACSESKCCPQRMTRRGKYSLTFAIVSPPLGLKCSVSLGKPALPAFTNAFQQSSVTTVTSQWQCFTSPRANATKGCTSPRVPRVKIIT
mmetsp:Transcript_96804/g.191929  ORF Transcript_96804/g.191929 Transcript_96804/m.191929 type:complete len:218 (-) Transcript_96804:716-1369(-)